MEYTFMFSSDTSPGLSHLQTQLDRLALEANFITNAANLFKSMGSNLLENIKSKFAGADMDSIICDDKELMEQFKRLSKVSRNVDFISLGNMLVDVPEGYTGKFSTLCATLTKLAPNLHSEAPKLLQDYNLILSAFITSKDEKISLTDHTKYFNQVDKDVKNYTKDLAKDFKPGRTMSKAKLSSTIGNYTELTKLENDTRTLIRTHRQEIYDEIRRQVNQATDLLTVIINGVNTGEIDNISPAAAMNISKGAEVLANYVELVGIYRYKLEQYVQALRSTIATINEKA